jgi:hypothetical protein
MAKEYSHFGFVEKVSIPSGFTGRLELKPSREITLATKRFDPYCGRPESFTVEVKVSKIPGRW